MKQSDSQNEYDDAYPSCYRTKVTLRIYHDTMNPEEITSKIGVIPTETQQAGVIVSGRKYPAKFSGWFLCSEGHIESKDSRRHLDWLLDRIESKAHDLRKLCGIGCRIDICCVWHSAQERGGPVLSVKQMQRIGDLGIEFWFDTCAP